MYPVVLVSSDGNEACFWEGEGAEVTLGIAVAVAPRVHQHHMQAWLVAMHRVQDDLRGEIRHKEMCIKLARSPKHEQFVML